MNEFVEGWAIVQTLGEGSYGEVKLLLNRNTGSTVAMKMIDLVKHPNAKVSVRKEVLIHSHLSHSNIVRYYGQRQDANNVYMFLEYASGGELFDRIEPDVGMPEVAARKYFSELLSGVEYLHSLGIAHRDLKPENLLLDDFGNLKISDFGMATFFRTHGKERLLDSKCGTLPYIAPEVLEKSYHAEPADIWSCGIILVALLSGELPWDKPTEECSEYVTWKRGKHTLMTPWKKIRTSALSLIRRILVPSPISRYRLQQIRAHRWYQMESSPTPMDLDDFHYDSPLKLSSFSQPVNMVIKKQLDDLDNSAAPHSFSQPTQIEDLLLSTQFLSSQSNNNNTNCLQNLVKRMTRFFINMNTNESIPKLIAVIEKLGYMWKSHAEGIITVSTTDRRRSLLTFKSSILAMEGYTLLDFRLSKGCGIEFKRCFMSIKREFDDFIVKGPSLVTFN